MSSFSGQCEPRLSRRLVLIKKLQAFITAIKVHSAQSYGRLYSFRFAVSDSHSDSNMRIDQVSGV